MLPVQTMQGKGKEDTTLGTKSRLMKSLLGLITVLPEIWEQNVPTAIHNGQCQL